MPIIQSFADFARNLRFFLFSRKGYKAVAQTQKSILLELMKLRYRNSSDEDILLALEYLKKADDLQQVVPYEQLKSMEDIQVQYDCGAGLRYVVHNGIRLYFPKKYSVCQIKRYYQYAVECEDIVGNGYRARTPHQYQSARFHLNSGTVLIDAGVAEGLFSLDAIEKAKKVYLVECAPQWWKPLQCTFAPWKDKVFLVEKKLSDKDDAANVRLKTLLNQEQGANLFVKMDIEGNEVAVLQDAKEMLANWESPITLSCCTYHRPTDGAVIQSLFNGLGYATEWSEGYILTCMNDANGIFSLRRGVLRASNKKSAVCSVEIE